MKCSPKNHSKALNPALLPYRRSVHYSSLTQHFILLFRQLLHVCCHQSYKSKYSKNSSCSTRIRQTQLCYQLQGCPMLQVGSHGMDGEQQAHCSSSLVYCHRKKITSFFSQFCWNFIVKVGKGSGFFQSQHKMLMDKLIY